MSDTFRKFHYFHHSSRAVRRSLEIDIFQKTLRARGESIQFGNPVTVGGREKPWPAGRAGASAFGLLSRVSGPSEVIVTPSASGNRRQCRSGLGNSSVSGQFFLI